VKVKICGVTRVEDAAVAEAAGASICQVQVSPSLDVSQ
jgi:phosphoribosylanthranilate isomerase